MSARAHSVFATASLGSLRARPSTETTSGVSESARTRLDPTFPVTAAVKGMLQRNTLGADMLKRLRVYAGADHGHIAQKPKALSFDAKGNLKIG